MWPRAGSGRGICDENCDSRRQRTGGSHPRPPFPCTRARGHGIQPASREPPRGTSFDGMALRGATGSPSSSRATYASIWPDAASIAGTRRRTGATILESRVRSTRLLHEAIAGLKHPPKLWVNASTATIYRHALDRAMNEATGELGGNEPGAPDTWNFSIDVAKAWEEAFFSTPTPLHAKDRDPQCDDLQSRSRRRLRCVPGACAAGPWRQTGTGYAIRFLDPRCGFRAGRGLVDRARNVRRRGQPGIAQPASQS